MHKVVVAVAEDRAVVAAERLQVLEAEELAVAQDPARKAASEHNADSELAAHKELVASGLVACKEERTSKVAPTCTVALMCRAAPQETFKMTKGAISVRSVGPMLKTVVRPLARTPLALAADQIISKAASRALAASRTPARDQECQRKTAATV